MLIVSIGHDAMSQFLYCVHRATETGRFVPNERITVHAGQDSDRGGLVLPACSPNDFLRACLRAVGILLRAFLVILGIVPIVDPFPDIAGHVVNAERAFARFIAPDRHEGLLADPPLIEVKMLHGGLDIAPGESPVGGALSCFFPFSFSRESFTRPCAVGLGIKPIYIDHGPISQ